MDWAQLIIIPLFTGAIGYITNLSGVWMLFNPIRFIGFRVPGLKTVGNLLPRRFQEIPGLIKGNVGWQGIVPSRAAKMGSIAVDKGISKLGSPGEFYQRLEPEKIAEHILATSERDIHTLVEQIMEREQPQLWADVPPRIKDAIHARVRAQLPEIVHAVTDQIGENIDQLLDVKLMVIKHLEAHPELANRIFLDIGDRELKLMVNFGFYLGFLLGVPVYFITHEWHYWWLLPILGTVVGYMTNLLAMSLIFVPVEPKFIMGIKFHGLFLRRQSAVADIYAKLIADEIVTLSNIGTELLTGVRADRTRAMIETAMRPAVDRATGPARAAVRVAMGGKEYDAIRDSVAVDAVDYTMTPLGDQEFNAKQSALIRELIAGRMREMAAVDFQEMLRSAIKEDEWMLYVHGAVLGFSGGLIHLAVFGV
ncbi:hypothetical protein DSM112329_01366 [Paraconexibacter sp. AEG42_29]|uniref:DUF445 domain-containing protein n=1 Tax=Paraconexibacter sp. AEG42_29 TaxID=2997339 RepID=A0AAU7ASD7_9ACTN